MHSVALPDNLNLPDPRSTRAHKLKLSMCLGLAHVFNHCISGYPSFLAMAIEIWCDWGAFSIIMFSVFAVSASLLTACNSPSIRPLHHCQVMACSTGEGNAECKQNEQWTAAIFCEGSDPSQPFESRGWEEQRAKEKRWLREKREGRRRRQRWEGRKKRESKGQLRHK